MTIHSTKDSKSVKKEFHFFAVFLLAFFTFNFSLFTFNLQAQNVGINATGAIPNSSTMLDLNTGSNFASPNGKGLLIPNIALTGTADVTTIATAATSLLVYNTATAGVSPNNVLPGYYYWNGSKWIAFGGTGGADWSLTGNAGTTVGTNFLGTTDARDLAIFTNGTEKMRVTSAGNVGIGTSTPSQKLHLLNGAFYVQNSNTFQSTIISSDGGVELYRSPSGSTPNQNGFIDFKGIESHDLDFRLSWDNTLGTNGGFTFNSSMNGSGGTTRMVILNSNGNVGIGTTTPVAHLDVQDGTSGANSLNVSKNFAGLTNTASAFIGGTDAGFPNNTGIYIVQKDNLSFVSAGTQILNVVNNGVSKMVVNGTGRVGVGTTTPVQLLDVNGNIAVSGVTVHTSDVRYKQNIKSLQNSLTKITQLRGVNYKWRIKEFPEKNFEKRTQIGVIAQEIEKIYPELVYTDAKGYKSVDYTHLTPVLIEAIKEQQKMIENLKLNVSSLKAENNQQKTEISNIQHQASTTQSRLEFIEAYLETVQK